MYGRVGFGGVAIAAGIGWLTYHLAGTGWALAVTGVALFLTYAYRTGMEADAEAKANVARRSSRAEPTLSPAASRVMPSAPPQHDGSWSSEWLNTGAPIDVQGRAVPGFMIYFGKRMPSVGSSEADPALINPRLAANHAQPDRAGSALSYWPSYSELTPEGRAAYLDWLATGRTDPSANIGYVFLFFYGLERRVLHDAISDETARSEMPKIVGELQRLLTVYGARSSSFYRYCTHLLDAIEVSFRSTPLFLTRPRHVSNTSEFPTAVRVALAQASAQGEPIPADWALAWYLSDPETRLRTPATRCPDELSKLFRARYNKHFGEGMLVKPNKTQLVVRYHPASRSFGGPFALKLPALPDVAILSAPRKRIAAIADECMDALDPYSRKVAQDPERGLATLALLPPELMGDLDHDGVGALRAWTARVLEDELTVANGAELIALWSSKPGEAMPKKEAVGLAQMLDAQGIGMEPDLRFGGSLPQIDEPVVLFRQGPAQPTSPSSAYTAATLLMRLGVAVAMADGVLSSEEKDFLENHIASVLNLAVAEKLRLRAHLKWLLRVQPPLTGLKKRIEALEPARRRAIAQFVVAAAGADGRIEPSEVKSLARIYKQLGLEEAEMHRELHNLSAGQVAPASEPVTVRSAGKAESFAIPAPPGAAKPTTSSVQLDVAKIQAKLDETAKVSALLAGIFAEDAQPASQPAVVHATATVAGLDAPLAELLFAVKREAGDSGALSRAQFEVLCSALRLMPDGALDKLNEAAFDKTDAPLLEGDEMLELNADAMKEMTA